MNILMVYPEFLVTFWSWKHLLKFISKKAAFPPLGLLTIAAMLPKSWKMKLVDINVYPLKDSLIRWADYVFISAMMAQRDSVKEVIERCKKRGCPVVVGGPILEAGCDEFSDVSHFLVGEAEDILPEFLADLQSGKAKRIYSSNSFPDLSKCPIPLWELINPNDYACMLMQYGRGCPFRCTFCNIAVINGRVPRAKPPDQFMQELNAIYNLGYRGAVMLADDNFIGNKKRVKELLVKLIEFQQTLGYPFDFTVEVDITLADDPELMETMVKAGFKKVFLGLETPNKESLIGCGKMQNANRDMAACVKRIQNQGLIPMSGFIVGFDEDNPETFDQQMIDFIQETGIVIAMVGVLQAPPKTTLYEKLEREGRLLAQASGNNTDCCPNFVQKMPMVKLVSGYKNIVNTIYSPKRYYQRIAIFFREYNTSNKVVRKVTIEDLKAFAKSVWYIGLLGGPITSYYYWKTLLLVALKHPKVFPEAVAFQIYGIHFQKITKVVKNS